MSKTRTCVTVAGIGAVAFTAWWVTGSNPAEGFSLYPDVPSSNEDRPASGPVNAVRWSDSEGTFADHGVRGLGGGLEYAIASDFCSRIIPNFIDQPSCLQLKQTVSESFDAWAVGNPHVRFVDVSNRVTSQLPPPGTPAPWVGYGAEIDLFTMSPDEYVHLANFGAWTQYWYVFADPVGTNGELIPGNTLTSIDVVFNSDVCYHLDPSFEGRGCNHFGSLVTHEVGHAIGLDHPNGRFGSNFDSGLRPGNPIAVDCGGSAKSPVVSPNVNVESVMSSTFGKPEPVSHGLSLDDLGGRDFLYPLCPAS